MGIGVLAIGVLFLAAGCASGISHTNTTIPTTIDIVDESEEVAEETTAEEPPSVAEGPELTIVSMQIDNIADALDVITMTDEEHAEEPLILAFGEIHDYCLIDPNLTCMSFPTTADHMFQEIFPLLARPEFGGIHDHVSEFFRNDPVVDQQIGRFYQGTDINTLDHIDDFMNLRDSCAIFSLLEIARDEHISIYGTQLNLIELPDASRLFEQYADNREAVRLILSANSTYYINNVYDQGRSVSFYGGASHINPDPPPDYAARSFGDELRDLYPNYRAIALIVPEIAERDSNIANPILIRLNIWRQYVPADGLTLLMTRVNGRRSLYYIIFPRTPASQVRPISRSEIHDCVSQP